MLSHLLKDAAYEPQNISRLKAQIGYTSTELDQSSLESLFSEPQTLNVAMEELISSIDHLIQAFEDNGIAELILITVLPMQARALCFQSYLQVLKSYELIDHAICSWRLFQQCYLYPDIESNLIVSGIIGKIEDLKKSFSQLHFQDIFSSLLLQLPLFSDSLLSVYKIVTQSYRRQLKVQSDIKIWIQQEAEIKQALEILQNIIIQLDLIDICENNFEPICYLLLLQGIGYIMLSKGPDQYQYINSINNLEHAITDFMIIYHLSGKIPEPSWSARVELCNYSVQHYIQMHNIQDLNRAIDIGQIILLFPNNYQDSIYQGILIQHIFNLVERATRYPMISCITDCEEAIILIKDYNLTSSYMSESIHNAVQRSAIYAWHILTCHGQRFDIAKISKSLNISKSDNETNKIYLLFLWSQLKLVAIAQDLNTTWSIFKQIQALDSSEELLNFYYFSDILVMIFQDENNQQLDQTILHLKSYCPEPILINHCGYFKPIAMLLTSALCSRFLQFYREQDYQEAQIYYLWSLKDYFNQDIHLSTSYNKLNIALQNICLSDNDFNSGTVIKSIYIKLLTKQTTDIKVRKKIDITTSSSVPKLDQFKQYIRYEKSKSYHLIWYDDSKDTGKLYNNKRLIQLLDLFEKKKSISINITHINIKDIEDIIEDAFENLASYKLEINSPLPFSHGSALPLHRFRLMPLIFSIRKWGYSFLPQFSHKSINDLINENIELPIIEIDSLYVIKAFDNLQQFAINSKQCLFSAEIIWLQCYTIEQNDIVIKHCKPFVKEMIDLFFKN